MADISNKTLAILIGIAIIVSVIGILSVPGRTTITGAAINTTTGTANVTIQSITQITLVNNTVDFGVGFVNGSDVACTLESNRSSKLNASNGSTAGVPCQGFNAPAIGPFFLLDNNGNVNVSVTMNGTFANARAFLCNASLGNQNCTQFAPEYTFGFDNFESGSCDDASFGATGFTRHLNITAQTICGNFDFNAASNSLKIPIRLMIPRDSIQGARTDSVLFTATSP